MGAALGAAGLGQVLDVVPNHMAITGRDNTWWWDVLENGPSSVYAAYFDVDWDPPESKLRNMVLLPDPRRPLRPGARGGRAPAARGRAAASWSATTTTPRRSPRARSTPSWRPPPPGCRTSTRPGAPAERRRVSRQPGATGEPRHRPRPAAALVGHRPRQRPGAPPGQGGPPGPAGRAVLRGRRRWPGRSTPRWTPSTPTPTRLDALLERQNYRLACWRTAGQELDYRRFFDIATLAGLRVEDDQVFADSHALILEFLADGRSRRCPHRPHRRAARPGGLPATGCVDAAPGAWVVVEKILEAGERLPGLLAGRRHDRLRLAEPGRRPRSSTRTGRSPSSAAYAAFTGEHGRLRRDRLRRQAPGARRRSGRRRQPA